MVLAHTDMIGLSDFIIESQIDEPMPIVNVEKRPRVYTKSKVRFNHSLPKSFSPTPKKIQFTASEIKQQLTKNKKKSERKRRKRLKRARNRKKITKFDPD